MDESTESARRIVTVEQTSRVIKFGDHANLDVGAAAASPAQKRQVPQYRVPTPKKFVQGQFRESDYESDADSGRIRPKWAPAESDTEEPYYRRVRPPAAKSARSSSAPVRQEHIASPMEFDAGPLTLAQTRAEDRKIGFQRYQHTATGKADYDVLRPGSPPEYGFASRGDVRKAADRKIKTCLINAFTDGRTCFGVGYGASGP